MDEVRSERVTFDVQGAPVVALLRVPPGRGRRAALLLDGPMTSVKEQAAGNYARALAERGYATLALDHRGFGESGGEPRQFESPRRKIEDLRAALSWLASLPGVDAGRLGVVGVCAGAGYAAGAVAADERVRAFGAVAGFYHDAAQQRAWMGEGFERAIAEGRAARERYERSGEVEMIPAVGQGPGPVAMPLAEAFEYYGTPRGAVPSYVNGFAVLSREETTPYDAQSAAAKIRVPSLIIHSDNALAPPLARSFFGSLAGDKAIRWLPSKGQIDFYDDPALIGAASDLLAEHFARTLGQGLRSAPAPRRPPAGSARLRPSLRKAHRCASCRSPRRPGAQAGRWRGGPRPGAESCADRARGLPGAW